MPFTKRTLLLGVAAVAGPVGPSRAATPAGMEARLGERAVGRADAPVTVSEYFSLTCGHCADFHRNTLPRVRSELVDAGRMRLVWRDFPLDQLALAAAMVARALPAERYEGFIGALFSTQDRWAFNRNGNPTEELAKLAAVAGMSRAEFDAVLADQDYARAVLDQRARAQAEFRVSSTPTFVVGTRVMPGALPFDRLAEAVREATPS